MCELELNGTSAFLYKITLLCELLWRVPIVAGLNHLDVLFYSVQRARLALLLYSGQTLWYLEVISKDFTPNSRVETCEKRVQNSKPFSPAREQLSACNSYSIQNHCYARLACHWVVTFVTLYLAKVWKEVGFLQSKVF